MASTWLDVARYSDTFGYQSIVIDTYGSRISHNALNNMP